MNMPEKIYHADQIWISDKIKGNGGIWGYNGGFNSRARIHTIINVPRYKVLYLNLCLWIRWIRRIIL